MDWINKIKTDSDASLKEVYSLYFEDITQWLRSKFNLTHSDAKEIFQLTVIILYENVISEKLLKLSSSLKSYLMGIARNKAMEQYRSKAKFIKDDILETFTDDCVIEHDRLTAIEQRIEIVESAMTEIGTQCKSILELFYFQGLSMVEITTHMNYKNSNTTKNLKYKCIKRLHNMLKDHINIEQ